MLILRKNLINIDINDFIEKSGDYYSDVILTKKDYLNLISNENNSNETNFELKCLNEKKTQLSLMKRV